VTRQEFDTWIEQHYTELLAVAKRRDQQEPEDVLQQAVAGMLASEALPRIGQPDEMGVWPWAVGFVRGTAAHARLASTRRNALKAETKKIHQAGSSLGRKQPAPRAE
jgi:hypothetical protein